MIFLCRHGVVVALEDDDDLLQPVYQEPYNNPNMQRGALVLQEKSLATSSASAAATSAEHEPIENIEDKELHFVKKGRKNQPNNKKGKLKKLNFLDRDKNSELRRQLN